MRTISVQQIATSFSRDRFFLNFLAIGMGSKCSLCPRVYIFHFIYQFYFCLQIERNSVLSLLESQLKILRGVDFQ